MRIELTLSCKVNQIINLNYQYQLSSVIYHILNKGSEEYARFLHDRGYKSSGKNFKLFTFALKLGRIRVKFDHAVLLDHQVKLLISSPLNNEFIQNFTIGLFRSESIVLTGYHSTVTFEITSARIIPAPEFSERNEFILLSPLVLAYPKVSNGRIIEQYVRPDETSEINRLLNLNLKNKYKTLYGKDFGSDALILTWDQEYLERKKRITKKITVNPGGDLPIDIIGMQAPFTLTGNKELISLGYECGFGIKNSMGFGFAEIRKPMMNFQQQENEFTRRKSAI